VEKKDFYATKILIPPLRQDHFMPHKRMLGKFSVSELSHF